MEKEKEGNINWLRLAGPQPRHVPLCHDQELNLQPFASQGGSQSTEPHQPGPYIFLLINNKICNLFPLQDYKLIKSRKHMHFFTVILKGHLCPGWCGSVG